MPRILVVEDDKDWQDILRDFFLSEDDCYEVVIAKDHSEAIKELAKAKSQEEPFDLATVDMDLSSSIGKVAGRRVVDYLKKQGIPCIVVSGSVQKTTEVRNLLKQHGVCDYIEKGEGFDFELFRKMVERALSANIHGEEAMLLEQQLSQAEDIGGDEQVSYLERRLRIHSKNLEELETRKAKYGMNPPLSLMNEIDHEKDEIRSIKEELARCGKPASSRNIIDS